MCVAGWDWADRVGCVKERQRGVETCSAKEQPSFLTHLPCLLSLCQPGAVHVWVCVCVFLDVKYTVGVWVEAGSGAGFNTQRCLCTVWACLTLHNIIHTCKHPPVVAFVSRDVSAVECLNVLNSNCDLLHTLRRREGSFSGWGVCSCACGGCWRMYGLQLWWASRQAFPSPFPCSALLLLTKPSASQHGGKTREMPVAPGADWED